MCNPDLSHIRKNRYLKRNNGVGISRFGNYSRKPSSSPRVNRESFKPKTWCDAIVPAWMFDLSGMALDGR